MLGGRLEGGTPLQSKLEGLEFSLLFSYLLVLFICNSCIVTQLFLNSVNAETSEGHILY